MALLNGPAPEVAPRHQCRHTARVFVSYSHDSEDHRARVVTLARHLLAAGHHVTLDRFTAHPDPNWPQWMARELIAAEVVLCICAAPYRERFEGTATGGFGVEWEGHIITTELCRMMSPPIDFNRVASHPSKRFVHQECAANA